MKRILAILFFLLFLFSQNLYADDDGNFAYIGQGLSKILTAAFQIPIYLVEKTMSEPIGLGTIDGALQGTYYSVAALLGGTLDIARGIVPYGKYALPFLFI